MGTWFRIGLLAALGAFFLGDSAQSAARAGDTFARSPTTQLRIAVWPRGKQKAAKPRRWTLRCEPVGGSLPDRARACRRLLALSAPFRPVPRGAVCTQIYGGPQLAEVKGRFRGRSLAATFTRTDGCRIARWDRVRFLFPSSSAA